MRIVLLGAYGYTAQILCQLLEEQNISFVAAGRNLTKLESLQHQFKAITQVISIDLRKANDLDPFINSFDVFINCAGPFTEESSAFVKAIAHSKNKVYLDITGELGFVKSSREENHEIAVANQTTIIHGCAFESFVVDLGVQLLKAKLGSFINLFSFYQFQHSKPSPGTRITMKLSKYRHYERVIDGQWQAVDHLNDRINMNKGDVQLTAVPYPLPEVAFSQWNFNPQNVMSYLVLTREEGLFVGAPSEDAGSIEKELEALKERKKEGPSKDERKRQFCEITIKGTNEQGKEEAISFKTKDMYKMTAQCIVKALSQCISTTSHQKGVISPSTLFKGVEKKILQDIGVASDNF